ncbi:MAG TPA: cyclic nucleotide-binding domain-containing protein [Verrucomicrobiota bacterium]|nr:cyclic nucleotide-binding domain-containing protein [Verrucomicrobiota bacterium]HNU51648.1 cyclic nucleotide-binding domain-containing protein [Verrucomicrobiota bacterium]
MQNAQTAPQYRVWGADNIAYGPFELPMLVTWIKQKRVSAASWIFVQDEGQWVPAAQLPELKMFFDAKRGHPQAGGAAASGSDAAAVVQPENLRRIKIFAEMDGAQLESFLSYLDVVKVNKFQHLFRKGDHGDAMYFVLEGEVRAMNLIDGKETTLFTLAAGESFGEIALLIHGPRTADVVANEESLLLMLPAAAFERVIREAPALAAPFLLAIARVITNRSLDMSRKYEGAIRSSRAISAIRL